MLCELLRECDIVLGGSMFAGHINLAATNLLGKHLKGLIVNPTDLTKKEVKRLAASDKKVNHGSRLKCTNSTKY